MAVRRFAEEQDPLLNIIQNSYQTQMANQRATAAQSMAGLQEHGREMAKIRGESISRPVEGFLSGMRQSDEARTREMQRRAAEANIAGSEENLKKTKEERAWSQAQREAMGATSVSGGYQLPSDPSEVPVQQRDIVGMLGPAYRAEEERRAAIKQQAAANAANIAASTASTKSANLASEKLGGEIRAGKVANILRNPPPASIPYSQEQANRDYILKAGYSQDDLSAGQGLAASGALSSKMIGNEAKKQDIEYPRIQKIQDDAESTAFNLESLANDVEKFERLNRIDATGIQNPESGKLRDSIVARLNVLSPQHAKSFEGAKVFGFEGLTPASPATIAKKGLMSAVLKEEQDLLSKVSMLPQGGITESIKSSMTKIALLKARLGMGNAPSAPQQDPASIEGRGKMVNFGKKGGT
jgi:hypothetical protein